MNKKEREEIRGLQGQWIFVVLAGMLALFIGLATTALYEILRERFSAWYVLILFGGLAMFLIDVFSHMFENLAKLRENQNETLNGFLWRYIKYRAWSLVSWIYERKRSDQPTGDGGEVS
jgi:hypothetical protein